ncbi:hypothetical protein BC831DRAFT_480423 [Entophlyctis helioformis]|nr:hypothetical protein BC831DRAFT_480423 [Entophlyctis helioformis]
MSSHSTPTCARSWVCACRWVVLSQQTTTGKASEAPSQSIVVENGLMAYPGAINIGINDSDHDALEPRPCQTGMPPTIAAQHSDW